MKREIKTRIIQQDVKYIEQKDFLELFGISRTTLYTLVNSGKIPVLKGRYRNYYSEEAIRKMEELGYLKKGDLLKPW